MEQQTTVQNGSAALVMSSMCAERAGGALPSTFAADGKVILMPPADIKKFDAF
jgi:hypothetical protein